MVRTRIGKHAIETLTVGMYEDPRAVYREYVQNSVDQIDKAKRHNRFEADHKFSIHITIDKNKRSIEIHDNATGIESKKSLEILKHIAESEKDSKKDRGFRGIGRLGGLAYCDELIFETSFEGEEQKSIVRWNALKLKKLIRDKSNKQEAGELIDEITTYDVEKEESKEYFFKVTMNNVSNLELLNVHNIREYLEMVAPVSYSNSLLFGKKIYNYLESKGIPHVSEYDIYVNSDQIFKPYTTHIYETSTHRKEK